ncbi:MAG: Asp-tRNA(Asn)/Glu-tRNA(Gln) amidotransferase subunit GatB [Planctomycetes bacterium]|nr:Asp-tRNA(Asn)/Glu-tRNA(Gln) amidotransferase subunit GatB [Planctomycetota bacterium]
MTARDNDIITPLIGVEIHVELDTETKMFCRCRNRFGDPPNTNVCPVCLGLPGALPVMNARAVEYAMLAGMALGCEVPDLTKWDRKNYYYPDLPKNYQISQYDLPLARDGSIDVPLPDGSVTTVRILRAHLEEDAGKNIHDHPGHTCVDLNRAGTPLLEIVSQPDMHSAVEVGAYGRAMQRLVRWLGVSQANMQMGHMRFEPNINLHILRDGVTYKTPIVEVKNLNSFRSLEGCVEYEIRRQYQAWCDDPDCTLEKFGKENRGYDVDSGRTVYQRSKEEAHDYRYFPDPDLVPVVVTDDLRHRLRQGIGELPLARRQRYMDAYGLSFKEADALTQDAATGDLLDDAVAAGATAKRVTNLLLGRVAAVANERGCTPAEVGVDARQLGELAAMIDAAAVNASAGDRILDILIAEGGSPRAIAEARNLLAVTDTAALEAWVDDVLAAHPEIVEQIRSGHKKAKQAFGFLMGQVMKTSQGKAPPAEAKRLLDERLHVR